MERIQEFQLKSKEKLKAADHLLTQTYKLLNDPKILVSVLENLNASVELGILTLLTNERKYKRITALPEDAEARIDLFDSVARRYGLDETFVKTARALNNSTELHRKSPVEFSRNENLIICTDTYQITKLTQTNLKVHIQTTKKMLEEVQNLTKNNDINNAED